jgi:hypothetical protein
MYWLLLCYNLYYITQVDLREVQKLPDNRFAIPQN